jgi:6-pyruvoyltetrahydropterin/6-carboxytetrahydropterin synthase
MSNQSFRVCLEKDNLVFSAAHFITFNGNVCESLHGHNYRVKCEITGPLDENGYVVDFIALRDNLAEIVNQLDHHVILPTEHAMIRVARKDKEVVATFENKRWVFPAEDCVLLPVANTTAELLARYIGQQLIQRCWAKFGEQIESLRLAVDENRGQWGVVEMKWESACERS